MYLSEQEAILFAFFINGCDKDTFNYMTFEEIKTHISDVRSLEIIENDKIINELNNRDIFIKEGDKYTLTKLGVDNMLKVNYY